MKAAVEKDKNVAPLVGAWIEITKEKAEAKLKELSLLSWERGLKSIVNDCLSSPVSVAPLVGAWIEIHRMMKSRCEYGSLLSWERGLKFDSSFYTLTTICRSSRGSVD